MIRDSKPLKVFLSTPSARRATADFQHFPAIFHISIHALREEGDNGHGRRPSAFADFYPRPPRGGRRSIRGGVATTTSFLSTPSARRATSPLELTYRALLFLSTPSARRATLEASL